jgi:hypothetical protein
MEAISVYVWSSFFALVVGGGFLLFLLSKLYKPQPNRLPYVRVPILTDTERRFFWKDFRPIGMKCVDFVIARRDTLTPLLVIELDDSTHRRAERRQRDQFVDRVLTSVAIPVLHWPVSVSYSQAELSQAITSKLRHNTA